MGRNEMTAHIDLVHRHPRDDSGPVHGIKNGTQE